MAGRQGTCDKFTGDMVAEPVNQDSGLVVVIFSYFMCNTVTPFDLLLRIARDLQVVQPV